MAAIGQLTATLDQERRASAEGTASRTYWVTPLVMLLVWSAFMPSTIPRTCDYPSDQSLYTEAAESLLAGRGLAFQGVYGVDQPLWRPLRSWPPGFALLIAVPHSLGLSASVAAVTINVAFAAAGALLIGWIAQQILPPGMALLTGLATICMPVYLLHSSVGTTDVPFTVLALGSIVCLITGLRHDRPLLILFAGLLAGSSFSLRYVGVTVVAASMLPFALRARRHDIAALARLWLLWVAGVVVVAGPLVAYNLYTTARVIPYEWAANQDSAWEVVRDTLTVLVQELTTSLYAAHLIVDKYVLAAILVVGLPALAFTVFRLDRTKVIGVLRAHQLFVTLALFVGLYLASLLSARLKYHLTDGGHGVWDRYLLPVHAVVWIGIALVAQAALRRLPMRAATRQAVVGGAFLVVIGLQVLSMTTRLERMPVGRDTLPELLGVQTAELLAREVGRDQIVLSCRADLIRRFGGINARFHSPAQFDATILRGPTREELNAAGRSGFVWGLVIENRRAAETGHYGQWMQQLVRQPSSFPELQLVATSEPVLVFKYIRDEQSHAGAATSDEI